MNTSRIRQASKNLSSRPNTFLLFIKEFRIIFILFNINKHFEQNNLFIKSTKQFFFSFFFTFKQTFLFISVSKQIYQNAFYFCFCLANPFHIPPNSTWKQNGTTIAGGNEYGNELNQLCGPQGIHVDDDNQCIYIADSANHRIVEWKRGATKGKVVAGGNGQGDRMDQLNAPEDVIVDKKTNSLIIADYGNQRVVRWSRQNDPNPQIIISNIGCSSLTMNNTVDLYVSNCEKNEVRRWKIGETNGTLVAGGNGAGKNLNQLNVPTYIFVDLDDSVYVSDQKNHRVMKWVKGAKEGIVVAGGQGEEESLTQLYHPQGVIVDHLDHVYVADWKNHRIMRWCSGSAEGSIVVGRNGQGQQPNQLYLPAGLSFDRQGNLYVVDFGNHRVQKFDINLSQNENEKL
jgi:sugar lactone lactonase YvrE